MSVFVTWIGNLTEGKSCVLVRPLYDGPVDRHFSVLWFTLSLHKISSLLVFIDSIISIVTGLQAGWSGVGILEGVRDLSPKDPGWLQGLPRTLFTGYQGALPGGKVAGCEADHSHPSNAELKNEKSCTSISHVYLHGMCRDSFTLFFFTTFCLYLYL